MARCGRVPLDDNLSPTIAPRGRLIVSDLPHLAENIVCTNCGQAHPDPHASRFGSRLVAPRATPLPVFRRTTRGKHAAPLHCSSHCSFHCFPLFLSLFSIVLFIVPIVPAPAAFLSA